MQKSLRSSGKLSRRQFLITSSSLALASVVVACAPAAPGGTGTAPASGGSAAPAQQAEEINFLIRSDIRNAYAADAALDRWAEAFPDRKLILDEPAEGAVDTKIQAAQAAGDLIWDGFAVIAVPWDTARWINQGLIQPLDDYIAVSSVPDADQVVPGIIPSVLESTKSEGKQYAIPGNVGSVALGWFWEPLQAAGIEPPTTWAEVMVAAERIKETSPELTPYDSAGAGALCDLVGMIWGATDTPYRNDGLIDWTGEAAVAALKWKQEMVKEGLMPGTHGESFGNWLKGGTAIMTSFDVHGTLAQQTFGDDAASTGINIRRDKDDAKAGAPFWINGCVVLNKSENPQGMTDFFLWWFGPSNEAHSQQIADVAAKPAYQYTYDKFIKDNPKHEWQLEGIELVRNSVPFQTNLTWGTENGIVASWIERAVDSSNNLSAEEALESALAEIMEEVEDMRS
jgi:spermidine/putrescine-binding protein